MHPNSPIEPGDDDGDQNFATSMAALAPPAPTGYGSPRRDDQRTSPSMVRQSDESESPPTMHTPMLTHYVHLPDRELCAAIAYL